MAGITSADAETLLKEIGYKLDANGWYKVSTFVQNGILVEDPLTKIYFAVGERKLLTVELRTRARLVSLNIDQAPGAENIANVEWLLRSILAITDDA